MLSRLIKRYLLDPYRSEFDSRYERPGRWEPCSTDKEHGEFLTAMVRLIKPKKIIETGTHYGRGAAALAEGCRLNGMGHVYTCDPERKQHLWTPDHGRFITYVQGNAHDVRRDHQYLWDLAFIDGDHTYDGCVDDINTITPRMSMGAIALIHDYMLFSGVADAIAEAHEPLIRLPSSVGLAIWQKR